MLATAASAFLLFQVQPILSKALLPSFGGSASVWNACLVFFQVTLFAGYALAHAAAQSPRAGMLGLALLAIAAVLALPVAPALRDTAPSHEVAAILIILSRAVGLPFLLLATAAPTLQLWYAAAGGGSTTYRLYAVSNLGALVALLSYPFFFEPRYSVAAQLQMWSFAFACLALLYVSLSVTHHLGAASAPTVRSCDSTIAISRATHAAWFVLPALTSALLMAVTEHVCRELTVMPFLWVVPLALYLLSFAIAFSGDDAYPRVLAPLAVFVLFALLARAPDIERFLAVQIGLGIPLVNQLGGIEVRGTLYLAFFFAAAFFCHCELYRRRPPTSQLTGYYLAISAGGALGGMLVALVCPVVFTDYFELPLLSIAVGAMALAAVVLRALRLQAIASRAAFALACSVAALLVGRSELQREPHDVAVRTFHGVLRVFHGVDAADGDPYVALYHGGVMHGVQYTSAERSREPTTYYSRRSGVGIALSAMRRSKAALNVGVIGLGAGTLAAYQRPTDVYRFYELDAAVEKLAWTRFSFLEDAPGTIAIEIGDGRLLLEHASAQNFDVLLVDAFSGDAVPAHLLTREAFAVYLRHVSDDGIIGVHVSNRYLRLPGVALGAAREHALAAVGISVGDGDSENDAASDWVFLSRSEDVLSKLAEAKSLDRRESVLWTDQRSDMFAILQ